MRKTKKLVAAILTCALVFMAVLAVQADSGNSSYKNFFDDFVDGTYCVEATCDYYCNDEHWDDLYPCYFKAINDGEYFYYLENRGSISSDYSESYEEMVVSSDASIAYSSDGWDGNSDGIADWWKGGPTAYDDSTTIPKYRSYYSAIFCPAPSTEFTYGKDASTNYDTMQYTYQSIWSDDDTETVTYCFDSEGKLCKIKVDSASKYSKSTVIYTIKSIKPTSDDTFITNILNTAKSHLVEM